MARGMLRPRFESGGSRGTGPSGKSRGTVIDAREIDLSNMDVPPITWSTPGGRSRRGWVPNAEPDEDPLGEAERKLRHLMKSMAENPDSLVTGDEQFDCPTCGKRIALELPRPDQVRADADHEGRTTQARIYPFRGKLARIIGQLTWRSAG